MPLEFSVYPKRIRRRESQPRWVLRWLVERSLPCTYRWSSSHNCINKNKPAVDNPSRSRLFRNFFNLLNNQIIDSAVIHLHLWWLISCFFCSTLRHNKERHSIKLTILASFLALTKVLKKKSLKWGQIESLKASRYAYSSHCLSFKNKTWKTALLFIYTRW